MNCPNCKSEITPSNFSVFTAMRREFRCKNCNNLFLVDYPSSFLWLFNTLPTISTFILVGLSYIFRDYEAKGNYLFLYIFCGYLLSSLILRFIIGKSIIKKMVLKEWKYQ